MRRLILPRFPLAGPSTPALSSIFIPPITPNSATPSKAHIYKIQTHRPFSNTPQISSSPFRLSSSTTPQQSDSHPPQEITPPYSEDLAPGDYYSPYKPKRQWPPDMSKLSPKHQFRLERKYRRRAALKYARPKWSKGTKLAQWGAIGFVLVYALLFMEWDERGSPFDEIRRTIFSGIKGAFSPPEPPRPVKREVDATVRDQ